LAAGNLFGIAGPLDDPGRVSLAEVKGCIAGMTVEERLEETSLMAHRNRLDETEYKAEPDGRLSAMDAGRRATASALEQL
jgi:hypothetical protein